MRSDRNLKHAIRKDEESLGDWEMRSDRNALIPAQECQDQGAAPGRSLLVNGVNSSGLPATVLGLNSPAMNADHWICDEQSP